MMNKSQWQELAELMSEEAAAWVNGHLRFLRSLYSGDDDHSGLVLRFFREFLGDRFEHLRTCVEFLGLATWLERNEPELYAELLSGTSLPVLREEDLANLPTAAP